MLLCATRTPLVGDCANLARMGVWSILPGEPEFTGSRPPFWREVYAGKSVSRISVLIHPQRFERGRFLDSFVTATDALLRFTGNRAVPLAAAGALLGRTLLKTAERETAPSGGEEVVLRTAPPRWPSTAQTLAFVCGRLGRSARLRAKARGKEMTWLVGIRPAPSAVDFRNPARGEPFREVVAPPGHYYADPFIVERDSRHWLFVEDWVDRNGRACLTCMEIGDGGRTGEPVVILESRTISLTRTYSRTAATTS